MSLTSDIIKATNPTEDLQRAIHLLFKDNMSLARCDTGSIIEAIKYCQLMGWLPGKMFKQAYFIPYGNKVQLIPGYKGLIKLAYENGYEIISETVHANDVFVAPYFDPEHGKIVDHQQAMERGEMIGAYAVALMRNGKWNANYLNLNDIWQKAQKGKSKGSKVRKPEGITLDDIRKLGGAYADFPEEMARVRAVAALMRDLDISPHLMEAVDLVDKQPEREVKQVKYQTEEDVISSMNGGV